MRVTVGVVLVLAFVVSAAWIARLDGSLARQHAELSTVNAIGKRLTKAPSELRAAQRGYVAETQGAPYWQKQVAGVIDGIGRDLDGLQPLAGSAATRERIEQSRTALNELRRIDRRAADHAADGRRGHAADLVFADALEASLALERSMDAAVSAALTDTTAAERMLRWRQLLIAGGMAAAGLLATLVLIPLPVSLLREVPPDENADRGVATSFDAMIAPADGWPATNPPVADTTETYASDPAPSSSEGAVLLTEAAALCGAVAQVQEPLELLPLLARFVSTLDARGAVVWLARPDGRALSPALVQGYSASSRTPHQFADLSTDDETPVTRSFRVGEVELVAPGNENTFGAIVVPILAPGGCAGVLAVEVNRDLVDDPAALALSRLLAAQLAGLVVAPGDAQPTASADVADARMPLPRGGFAGGGRS